MSRSHAWFEDQMKPDFVADPTHCPSAELLARAAERGLEDVDLAPLRNHLADCPGCRRLLTEVVLERLPGEPPTLQPLPDHAPSWLGWLVPLRRPALLLGGVGVLLAGLALASPFLFRSKPPSALLTGPAAGTALPPVPPRWHGSRPAAPPQSVAMPAPAPVLVSPARSNASREAAPPSPGQEVTPARQVTSPSAHPAPPGPLTGPKVAAPSLPGHDDRAARNEERFVEGVVHFQAARYPDAIRSFDRLLADQPTASLAEMASRWKAKAEAEYQGECQPGYVRRIRLEQAAATGAGGGLQGPTQHIDCVPDSPARTMR